MGKRVPGMEGWFEIAKEILALRAVIRQMMREEDRDESSRWVEGTKVAPGGHRISRMFAGVGSHKRVRDRTVIQSRQGTIRPDCMFFIRL